MGGLDLDRVSTRLDATRFLRGFGRRDRSCFRERVPRSRIRSAERHLLEEDPVALGAMGDAADVDVSVNPADNLKVSWNQGVTPVNLAFAYLLASRSASSSEP